MLVQKQLSHFLRFHPHVHALHENSAVVVGLILVAVIAIPNLFRGIGRFCAIQLQRELAFQRHAEFMQCA